MKIKDVIDIKSYTEDDKGLIISAYEHKFGELNTNGEVFIDGCLDKFIEEYYITNQLNIPVRLEHQTDFNHLVGKVTVVENTGEGYRFELFIPKGANYYDTIKLYITEGILQGLSKVGYATEYDIDPIDNIIYISEMTITEVSLVAIPANKLKIDKVVENTVLIKPTIEEDDIINYFN